MEVARNCFCFVVVVVVVVFFFLATHMDVKGYSSYFAGLSFRILAQFSEPRFLSSCTGKLPLT